MTTKKLSFPGFVRTLVKLSLRSAVGRSPTSVAILTSCATASVVDWSRGTDASTRSPCFLAEAPVRAAPSRSEGDVSTVGVDVPEDDGVEVPRRS